MLIMSGQMFYFIPYTSLLGKASKIKKIMENSNKKKKNDLRATKRILYDMGNFFYANRPCYGLSLFYFW